MNHSDTFKLTATSIAGAGESSVSLIPDSPIRIGRLPTNQLPVSWDRAVSREHATAELINGFLRVICLPGASNPITTAQRQVREVTVRGGDRFQIGQTVFHFEAPFVPDESSIQLESSKFEEYSFVAQDLKSYRFRNIDQQMSLLMDIPELMSAASSDAEVGRQLANLLLQAIPGASAVAAAFYSEAAMNLVMSDEDATALVRPDIMRIETRSDYTGRFLPSRRLVGRAFRIGESTIHVWGAQDESGCFTLADELNWAFCVPVSGVASRGWCLYVAGHSVTNAAMTLTKETLEPDVRFAQLLAQFIGSFHQVRRLKETQTQLSSFFSPKVIENLTGGSAADVLDPSERQITVLFCDVRGFSRKSEQYKDDLLKLLDCVKAALGVMTQGILNYDGAIADFQGDAALGFWGWPVPLSEGAIPACLAALNILDDFRHPERHGDFLDGFSIGLGIAHGRAVAGQIGTTQQAKIGVFGPVVNQGSRIEGLTRLFDVSICIDEATAAFARESFRPDQARVRCLARIRPKGMDTAITVSELLPPFGEASTVSDDHISRFEAALDLVISGEWASAVTALNALPDEGPTRFLLQQMSRLSNAVPADWDGAFSMNEK